MTYILISGLIILVPLSLYVGYRWSGLYKNGVINTYRRISIKQLNKALSVVTDSTLKKEIMNLKNAYVVYVSVFWLTMLFTLLSILLK